MGVRPKTDFQKPLVLDRSFSRKPVFMRREERIMKGSMEVRRVLNQSIRPDFAYFAAVFGKNRRNRRKQEKDREQKKPFIGNVLRTFIKNI